MTTVGADTLKFELVEDFPTLPDGESFAVVSTVATDSQDNLYVFQRTDPPVVVFDREGNYLNAWGHGAFNSPHGMSISDDVIYLTDRDDSVAVSYTLEGRPLLVLGDRGVHSDTGCETPADLVPRAAGPFNYPTEMVKGPSGDIYVSDGYRNSRIHKFTAQGELIKSWGTPGSSEPGEFHLPHSLMVDAEEKVYVCDRTNRRVQIFDSEGEFITMWTGMGGPNDIVQGPDGLSTSASRQLTVTPRGPLSGMAMARCWRDGTFFATPMAYGSTREATSTSDSRPARAWTNTCE